MSDQIAEQQATDEAPASEGNRERGSRQRSDVKFPYAFLDDVVEIVEAMYQTHGTEAEVDQLAAAMGSTTTSSMFRTKIASANVFGVLRTVRGEGRLVLTDLGKRVADPSSRQDALIEAFYCVPLYRLIYNEFKGSLLPGDQALEAEMVRLGVSDKVVGKARQVFARSAKTAGFFEHGPTRLVEPARRSMEPSRDKREDKPPGGDAGNRDRKGGIVEHPLIRGLLEVLPPPGEPLPKDRKDLWIDTLKMNLSFIYPEEAATSANAAPSATERPSGQSPSVAPETGAQPSHDHP